MNKEQKLFVDVISSSLNNRPIADKNLDAWFKLRDNIQIIAKSNYCLPVAYQGAVINSFPVSLLWQQTANYNVIDFYRKMKIESEIIDILNQNGIRACILKGSSVARCYPNPLMRPLGDIDVLVDEQNYEVAALLFVSKEKIDNNSHDFHVGFDFRGVTVEIHKYISDFSGCRDGIKSMFNEFMNSITTQKCEDFDVPVLASPYQALSLLTHMIRHFSENKFVFRMFCDWACFVNSVSDDEWINQIYPLLKNSNLEKFSDVLNRSAEMYLGFNFKNKIISDVDDELCKILTEEFMSIDKSSTSGGMDVNIGTIFSQYQLNSKNIIIALISSINHVSKTKYSLGKYKICRPLFWIYLPLKYIFNMLRGKKKKLNFQNITNTATRRSRIYRELNL